MSRLHLLHLLHLFHARPLHGPTWIARKATITWVALRVTISRECAVWRRCVRRRGDTSTTTMTVHHPHPHPHPHRRPGQGRRHAPSSGRRHRWQAFGPLGVATAAGVVPREDQVVARGAEPITAHRVCSQSYAAHRVVGAGLCSHIAGQRLGRTTTPARGIPGKLHVPATRAIPIARSTLLIVALAATAATEGLRVAVPFPVPVPVPGLLTFPAHVVPIPVPVPAPIASPAPIARCRPRRIWVRRRRWRRRRPRNRRLRLRWQGLDPQVVELLAGQHRPEALLGQPADDGRHVFPDLVVDEDAHL
mmetsp:Transcript_20372/g.70575  ORF Transcript_20372/g.70575 Transcript_20372/m.70575 type:complete len:305 (+) Transcript_20372:876-1790(+)